MILQGKVVPAGILAAAAVVFLIWLTRNKGRSWWLWLLPVFVCAGMGRSAQVVRACEQELGLGLDGRHPAITGRVCGMKESGEWLVLELDWVLAVQAGSGETIGPLGRIQVYLEAGSLPEERLPGERLPEEGLTEERLSEERLPEERLQGERLPEERGVCIGYRVRCKGEVSAFEPARNPGEFDYRLYYRSQKLNYRMFARTCEVLEAEKDRYRQGLFAANSWASRQLGRIADPEDAGILRAVILGDKTALSETTRSLYQDNGLAHLLAISGLHLSLVSLAAYGLIRRMGAGFGAAGLAGGAVLISYALMTGAGASVVRALLMVLCGFLAAYLGRTYDLLSALGLAALWLFFDSPYLLCQAGAQLSFGAVVGIGGLAPCLERRIPSAPLRISIAMQVTTLPLVLYHFFQYPLYGMILNLLVVPLMGIVIATGAAGILAAVWSPGAGRFVVGGGCVVLGWYEGCCRFFGSLPGSSLVLGRPQVWQIGVYYGVVAVIAFVAGSGTCGADGAGETTAQKHTAREKAAQKHTAREKAAQEHTVREKAVGKPAVREDVRRKMDVQKAAAEEAVEPRLQLWILAALLAATVVLLPLPVQGLEVAFLDVGQGDGICLQTRTATILVDGGSTDRKDLGEQRLEPFLKSRGIRAIDYAVVSHGDQDHISGLRYLMEEHIMPIRNLLLPVAGRGDEVYAELERLARLNGSRVVWMEAGDVIGDGGGARKLQIRCLYPSAPKTSYLSETRDRNEDSLVLQVEYGAFSMVLTGDMSGEGEARLLAELKDPLSGAQVLKVAHHGSRYSTTEAWLDAVAPSWAVISYGEENRYGHPHEEVMERLDRKQVTVFETGESGAVMLHTDGERIWWSTWLDDGG